MTTTPEEPRAEHDEPEAPPADAPADAALSSDGAPPAAVPAAGDTQPVPPMGDTAPLPTPAPAAYAPPYTGPAQQRYPQRPYAPAGPAYPAPQQQYGPYPPYQLGQPPVPPQVPPAAPQQGQQPGAVPATRTRSWLPIVATLVVVVLLAAAAIWIGTGRFPRGEAAAGTAPSSVATIGQSDSGSVPVAGSDAASPNWAAVASAVSASVVSIAVQTQGGEALGSGVVVDDQAHVVTNDHVVEGAQDGTVQVTLSDGRIYDAEIVGTDPSTDLAVVEIQDPPSDLAVAQFGDSDVVAVGDPVMAVGNPLGLANTVTTGIVSAVDRPVSPRAAGQAEGPVTNAIQIDAAINPGNSGGPLFDAQGRVIGITSSIATTSSDSGSIGLGFAIPVNLVRNIAQQLVDDGRAEHAYLGVSLRSGTATADGVTRRGAEVMEVSDGSPAAEAGIETGDVVVAVNGKPVGGADSLAAYVRAMTSGEQANLMVVRDGGTLSVDVTLATRPDTATQAPSDGQNQDGRDGRLEMPGGMTPQELWNWLQEHADELGNGNGGSGQG